MINEVIYQGFQERVKNIGGYYPLFDLVHKGRYEKTRYKDFPLFSLGLGVLLFILENMLQNQGTSTEEITEFLQSQCLEKLNRTLSFIEADQLRSVLVDEFLRNNGEPFSFPYYNFESNKEEAFTFHLLEYDNYNVQDLKEKRIRLKLTELGVEILFKTKEIFNELKLSISQLLFRQRFEKGYFSEALRIINEMALQIQNEIDKTRTLQNQVLQNALELSKQRIVEKQLDRINDQFTREQETFNSHRTLVKNTMEDYYEGKLTEKEAKGIDVIAEVKDRLLKVIRLHETLFAEKQTLQRVMSESLENVLINAFRISVNFEREVLEEIKQQPSLIHTIPSILRPLLPPSPPSILHPEVLFQVQQRFTRQPEAKEKAMSILNEQQLAEQEQEERERQQKRERIQQGYLRDILSPLIEKECYSISQALKWCQKRSPDRFEQMIHDPNFYSLLIDMHQSEDTAFKIIEKEYLKYLSPFTRHLQKLIEQNPAFLEVGYFSIKPSRKRWVIGQYEIPDFTLQRGDLYALAKK